MKTNFPIDYFVHGRRVRYVPGHAAGPYDLRNCEDGTVSSRNGKSVFVRFDKQVRKLGWNGATSKLCDSCDLWSDPDWHIVHSPILFFSVENVYNLAFESLRKS